LNEAKISILWLPRPNIIFAFNKEMVLLQTSIYIHWHYTGTQQGWVACIGT